MNTLFRSSPWYGAVALGLCYFVVAAITVTFTRFDGGVAFIWASSGLLIARLAQLPVAKWGPSLVACGVAIFAMSTWFGFGVRAAPAMTLVNLCEPIMAALLLRRLVGQSVQTQTVGAVAWFIGIAGILAPAVSGIGGALVISRFAPVPFMTNWLNWFAAHGIGALLVTPLASVLMSGEARRWQRQASRSRTLSTMMALAIVAGVTAIVFVQNRMPILFLPMLPMVFAKIRGGRLGAIASAIILAVIAGVFSAYGSGPVHLMKASVGARSIFLQAYVAYAVLLVLPIAAILKQREALMQRLTESEARYRSIADSLGDAIVDVGLDGTIRYASPAIANLAGQTPDMLIGASAKDLVFADDVPVVWAAHQAAVASPGQAFTAQYRGSTIAIGKWFEVSIRAIVSTDGVAIGVVGSIRDITVRKAEERTLQHEAQTDVLTGLPNRRAFQGMLEAAVADEEGANSLAIFDLDRFKAINDTYGHAAGDAVLVAVAKAAQASLRTTDRIGRIGGEEFGVVFHVRDAADAKAAAERLQAAIRRLQIPIGDGRTLRVTVSMGLAEMRGGGIGIDQIMAAADAALYDAKRSGRDCLKLAA